MQRLVLFSPTLVSCTQYNQFIYIFKFPGYQGVVLRNKERRIQGRKGNRETENNRGKNHATFEKVNEESELRGNRAIVCSKGCETFEPLPAKHGWTA